MFIHSIWNQNSKRSCICILFCGILVFQSSYGQNLLTNPDAEAGDISGWVDSDGAWDASDEITPHGGDYFFWPALEAIGSTMMYQDVDVPSSIPGSASDSVFFHLSGWLCNWDQYPHDRATLAIEAQDADGAVLAYYQTEQRSPAWTFHSINQALPPSTATLRVILIATRFVGSDNDGYFDDLSLTVDRNTSPVITISTGEGAENVAIDEKLELTASTAGGSDNAYQWSSSFPSVATVDSNGVVTGIAAGRVFIYALGMQSGVTGSIELSITETNDIVFTSPVTDALLHTGSVDTVTWNVIGSVSTGNLSLSTDGGVTFIQIESAIDCSLQKYVWNLPGDISMSRQCVLKMTWSNGNAVSGIFTIDSLQAVPVIYNSKQYTYASQSKIQLLPSYLINGRRMGPVPGNTTCSIIVDRNGKKKLNLKTGMAYKMCR